VLLLKGLKKKFFIRLSHLIATVGSTETQNHHSVSGQKCKCATLGLVAKHFCIEEVSDSLPCRCCTSSCILESWAD